MHPRKSNRPAAARAATILAATLLVGSGAAHAHGDATSNAAPYDPAKVEPKAYGRAGDPAKVTRTMTIRMGDTMRFSPAEIVVRKGETVRFVVRNDGKQMHELVLGTDDELAEHAALMAKFPGMKHDEPWMVHVAPGKRADLVWTFDRPGEFRFACLLPGHFEAGMVGRVTVR